MMFLLQCKLTAGNNFLQLRSYAGTIGFSRTVVDSLPRTLKSALNSFRLLLRPSSPVAPQVSNLTSVSNRHHQTFFTKGQLNVRTDDRWPDTNFVQDSIVIQTEQRKETVPDVH